MKTRTFTIITAVFVVTCFFITCSQRKNNTAGEQIAVSEVNNSVTAGDTSVNSVADNATMKQVYTFPHEIILTGFNDHRLVSIYKPAEKEKSRELMISKRSSYDSESVTKHQYFMPGIDMLSGYNFLNVIHYDMRDEKANHLFNHSVIIEALYYPSLVQDSIDKQPVTREYYLVSVYDEDTNKDTQIDRKDLNRFYHFDLSGIIKTPLIPSDHSVLHYQYDFKNDVMYVFAMHDENKNGTEDTEEPIHVFWFSLKIPGPAKLLY